MDAYQKPDVTTDDSITSEWNPRIFVKSTATAACASIPPLVGEYVAPPTNPAAEASAIQMRSTTSPPYTAASRCVRVPAESMAPYKWIVKIYSRCLAAGTQDPPPNNQYQAKWTQATAWFAKAAHEPNTNAQYLMTAASNVSARIRSVDKTGKITKPNIMETVVADAIFVVADAIFVVASYGSNVFTHWIDNAAMMFGYFNDPANLRFDGAALHIKDSFIPPEFWQQAPEIAFVPYAPTTPPAPTTYTRPLTVAGFPSTLNRWADTAGLYVSGTPNVAAGVVAGYVSANFQAIPFTRQPPTVPAAPGLSRTLGTLPGNLVIQQGQAGSPYVVMVAATVAQPVIVASHNGSGIGAPFEKRQPGARIEDCTEPVMLLGAVGARENEPTGMRWFDAAKTPTGVNVAGWPAGWIVVGGPGS